jgi:hypothetical protein
MRGGGPGGLNNLDAHLDLHESAGKHGAIINKRLMGGGLRPEMDSFYQDREDIK